MLTILRLVSSAWGQPVTIPSIVSWAGGPPPTIRRIVSQSGGRPLTIPSIVNGAHPLQLTILGIVSGAHRLNLEPTARRAAPQSPTCCWAAASCRRAAAPRWTWPLRPSALGAASPGRTGGEGEHQARAMVAELVYGVARLGCGVFGRGSCE